MNTILPEFNLSEKQTKRLVFLAFLAVRVLFVVFSGYSSFALQPDSARYNQQSSAILAGNYNLIEPLFITAPFYPYFEAVFKFIFGTHWIFALQSAQILLCCLSGVCLYEIAKLLWEKREIALTAAAIYCFYPFTFWWVHTFTQDMPFQYELIFTVFFLLKAVYQNHFPSLIIAAVLFSITFLTKSHILLFAPFIPLFIMFAKNRTIQQKIIQSVVFTVICFVFTLPYGLYNLKANGIYVISSTGQGGFFLTGHNDDVYNTIVSPPVPGSIEAQKLLNLDFDVFRRLEPKKAGLSETEIQKMYFAEGWRWCLENPGKLVTLAGYNLFYFILPGLNPNWYSFKQWFVSFVICLPLYLFAYFGIISALKKDFGRHVWILGLFTSMVLFSVGFYVQNRFRTITLEPFYILYAAPSITQSIYYILFKGKLLKENDLSS